MGTPSQSYGMSLAIREHTVLPATRHKWTHPALTPARQAGTQFNYPVGMEGWVDLGDWLHTEMVTVRMTLFHMMTLSVIVLTVESFHTFVGLVSEFPSLKEKSQFVFVPGPRDPGPGPILPRWVLFHFVHLL